MNVSCQVTALDYAEIVPPDRNRFEAFFVVSVIMEWANRVNPDSMWLTQATDQTQDFRWEELTILHKPLKDSSGVPYNI